jgi:hypothetical protein
MGVRGPGGRWAGMVAVVLLAAPACAGDDDPGSARTPGPPATAEAAATRSPSPTPTPTTYCEALAEDQRRFQELVAARGGAGGVGRVFEMQNAELHELMRTLAPPEIAADVDVVLDGFDAEHLEGDASATSSEAFAAAAARLRAWEQANCGA